MHTQTLSFSLRIARTRADLLAACKVRAESYGHHLPNLRAAIGEPDLLDGDEHTHVVLCVDKISGDPVGTVRVQTNAGSKLLIEHSTSVPEAIASDSRAEITRLAAMPGADPLVKLALMKASYLYCVAAQVRWMVIGARSEALIRQYRRLGFENLFDDDRRVALLHAGHLDHQLLKFNVTAAERTWHAGKHALYSFMIETRHPDIDLFTTQPALARRETVASRQTRERVAPYVVPSRGPTHSSIAPSSSAALNGLASAASMPAAL